MIKNIAAILILSLFIPHLAEAREYPPRWVEMELEEVEDATSYELEFKSKKSGKAAQFKTETTEWKAKVKPGQYEMRLRSYDERKVPGPWSDYMSITIAFPGPKMQSPKQAENVATSEEDQEEVKFQWEKLEGVAYYRLEVQSGEKKWTEVTDDNEFELKLPVAQEYTWNVYAMQDKEDTGEGSDEANKFVLLGEKLDEPEILAPIDKYVNEIGWTAPKRAEFYTYMLSRKNENGKWKRISRGRNHPKRMIDIPQDIPGGRFRLQVRAEAPNITPSDIEKLEFDIFLGSRDPASVNENRLKESIEKPTNMYFIASYLITNMEYQGVDKQKDWAGGFPGALGGTGRLGLGYIEPGATWGGMGIIDYSGFDLNGEIKQFASAEAHATWRKYFGPSQLRLSSGLFFKEIVETNPFSSTDDSKFVFEKVKYYGPHVGFDYWRPISPKLGWQANARLYLSMGGSTPNGSDVDFTPSYQLGFMGSYKLSKNIMGFAGYAFRKDSVTYDSTVCSGACGPGSSQANNGDKQEINLSGHYLNFLLEWGF